METEYGALEGYGAALSNLCRESELTITEIARRAGITRGQLYKALAGENDLSIRSLGKILAVLEKRLFDLAEVMEIQQGHGLDKQQRDYIRRLLVQLGTGDSGTDEGLKSST